MKARLIDLLALVLVALAVLDLSVMIPSMRAARRRMEAFSGGSNAVHDVYFTQFGVDWWVAPASLILAAIAIFSWNRKRRKE